MPIRVRKPRGEYHPARHRRSAQADPYGMDEKLRALALIRASMTEDTDALRVMLSEAPRTPDLVAELAGLAGAILTNGLGPEKAVATVDRYLRLVLEAGSATRARGEG